MPDDFNKFLDRGSKDDIYDISVYNDTRKALEHAQVPTRSVVSVAAEHQRAFVADSGSEEMSDTIRFYAENASTDRVIVFYRIHWYNGGGDDFFAQIFRNPDTNLPSTEVSYINLYSPAGTTAPSTVLNAFLDDGTTSMSGGDATGVELTITQGSDNQDFLYYLEPGEGVGINLDTGGSLTAATAKFTLFYFEVPI